MIEFMMESNVCKLIMEKYERQESLIFYLPYIVKFRIGFHELSRKYLRYNYYGWKNVLGKTTLLKIVY